MTPRNTPMSSTTTNVVCVDWEEEAESSSVDRSNLKRNEAKRSSSAALLNEPSRKKRREEGSPHGETSGTTVAVAIFDDGASESAASANTVENLGREGLASADPDLVNAARNILLSLDASNCELEAVDPLEDLLFDVESESDAQVTASSENSELPRYSAFSAEPKDPATGPLKGWISSLLAGATYGRPNPIGFVRIVDPRVRALTRCTMLVPSRTMTSSFDRTFIPRRARSFTSTFSIRCGIPMVDRSQRSLTALRNKRCSFRKRGCLCCEIQRRRCEVHLSIARQSG